MALVAEGIKCELKDVKKAASKAENVACWPLQQCSDRC